MDNQAVINFKNKHLYIAFTIAFCTFFFSKIVFAKQYQLQLLVDLSGLNGVTADALWLEPVTIPSSEGEFFVAQSNGLIYLANKEVENNQESILNFPLDVNTSGFIALTSMALHPSFSDPEQTGYATLFTSHITEFDHKKNHKRLMLNDTNIAFDFETVITAWQYDFDSQSIEPQTQREVLRIPIKTLDSAIQNLTFDPYQKSWNTDYGQLYFSLKYHKTLEEYPLYSGVILSIYPLMFGARNYTVPQTNPFIKEPEINDEIVVMGAQNIEHFFWSKYDHGSMFIQHNNSEQYWLSKAKKGENLLTQPQANFLWQQSSAMSSMLLYQGRSFLNLRNKMVFFTLLDSQWHLTSLALTPSNNESPIFEKLITEEPISPTSHLSIFKNNQGEIVLIDNQKSRMYSLHPSNSKVTEVSEPELNTTAQESYSYLVYISLLFGGIVLGIVIYSKKASQKRSIDLLDKEHLLFKYEVASQNILLFKPNQKKVYKTLPLSSIIGCDVVLNNHVIKIIDAQPENSISNQNEEELRSLFRKEQREKMLTESNRHINVVLTDKNASYTVSLYLRKGNARVTGAKYYDAVDILMDLCWNISKQINPQATETRVIPLVAFSRPNVIVPAKKPVDTQPISHDLVNDAIKDPTESKTATLKPTSQEVQHTEVVNALDKLVNLHQQGYLTDEEFSLAKTKLLQNLLDT